MTETPRTSFRTTLTSTLEPKDIIKLALEGDKEWMRNVVTNGMWRNQTYAADFKQVQLFEFFFYHGAKWLMLNPNETNRQISRIMDEIHRIADSRDEVAKEKHKPIWNESSSIKNPAGRLSTVMIIPAFQKSITSIWSNEGPAADVAQEIVCREIAKRPTVQLAPARSPASYRSIQARCHGP